MIEMLKSALARQRKSNRLKFPSRSINSPHPSTPSKPEPSPKRPLRTASSSGNLKLDSNPSSSSSPDKSKFRQVPQNNSSNYSSFKTVPRRNSADLRSESPLASNRSGSVARSPSEKGLSIDFRKQLREKIDKKARERMSEAQNEIYYKWQGILFNNIREIVHETDQSLRKNWKGLLDGKGKEAMSRLKEFSFKSFEVIRQSKLQKKVLVGKVAGGFDELVAESISKFQYKFTNAVEKNLEAQVQRRVSSLMEKTQVQLEGIAGDFILQAFAKVALDGSANRDDSERSRKTERSERSIRSENTEKSAKSDLVGRDDKSSKLSFANKSGNSQFALQGKAPMVKAKMNTGKPGNSMPQINIASTLQGFLKFEQVSQK